MTDSKAYAELQVSYKIDLLDFVEKSTEKLFMDKIAKQEHLIWAKMAKLIPNKLKYLNTCNTIKYQCAITITTILLIICLVDYKYILGKYINGCPAMF